jgi:hypothetical protein
MKIEVSETQFRKIVNSVDGSQDIKEQGEAEASTGGAQGYPAVGKWKVV